MGEREGKDSALHVVDETGNGKWEMGNGNEDDDVAPDKRRLRYVKRKKSR